MEHKNSDGEKLMRWGAGRKERVGCGKTGTPGHMQSRQQGTPATRLSELTRLCNSPEGPGGEGGGAGAGGRATGKPVADSC